MSKPNIYDIDYPNLSGFINFIKSNINNPNVNITVKSSNGEPTVLVWVDPYTYDLINQGVGNKPQSMTANQFAPELNESNMNWGENDSGDIVLSSGNVVTPEQQLSSANSELSSEYSTANSSLASREQSSMNSYMANHNGDNNGDDNND